MLSELVCYSVAKPKVRWNTQVSALAGESRSCVRINTASLASHITMAPASNKSGVVSLTFAVIVLMLQ